MKLKLQILVALIYCISTAKSQSNIYFVNGQLIDSLPQDINWYAVLNDNSIDTCNPKIQYIKDAENNFEGNIIDVNLNSSLIIGSKKKLNIKTGLEISEKDKLFAPNSKLILNSNEILFAKMNKVGKDEIYSLFVYYRNSNEESEIYRNCRKSFGCGRVPFIIDFFGDLTGDGISDILLSAEKEGGILKVLIGKTNGIYEVLYYYETE